jgi:hypothetical protein
MKLLYPLTTLLAVLTAATTVVSATGTEGGIVYNDGNGHLEYETAAERSFDGVVHAIDWDEYEKDQENPEDRTGDVEGGLIIGGVPVETPPEMNSLIVTRRKIRPKDVRGSLADAKGGAGGAGRRQGALRGRRQEEEAATAAN